MPTSRQRLRAQRRAPQAGIIHLSKRWRGSGDSEGGKQGATPQGTQGGQTERTTRDGKREADHLADGGNHATILSLTSLRPAPHETRRNEFVFSDSDNSVKAPEAIFLCCALHLISKILSDFDTTQRSFNKWPSQQIV